MQSKLVVGMIRDYDHNALSPRLTDVIGVAGRYFAVGSRVIAVVALIRWADTKPYISRHFCGFEYIG